MRNMARSAFPFSFARLGLIALLLGLLQADQVNGANTRSSETPWPCKTEGTCLAFEYICDGEKDCPDGYDEKEEMCIAKDRPAKENIKRFLDKFAHWLFPQFLDWLGDTSRMAELLVTSPNLSSFAQMAQLTPARKENLRELLESIRDFKIRYAILLGMPPHAWDKVKEIFGKIIIIKSGFLRNEYSAYTL